MNKVQLKDAKARLSELLDAAESGEPTTITRHGKPVGVLVPIAAAEKIYADKRTLLEVLMSMPSELPEIERDTSPFRAVNFR